MSELEAITAQRLPAAYAKDLYRSGDRTLETALNYIHFGQNNGEVPAS